MTTTRLRGPQLAERSCWRNCKKLGPLNLPVSRRNTKRPSRKRTAPKYPTLLRVGAWSRTGSLISGGIHMRQREPCCGKCTSSVGQRSTLASCIKSCSFFYGLSEVGDWPEPAQVAVYACGSRVDGTYVGTGVPRRRRRISAQSRC